MAAVAAGIRNDGGTTTPKRFGSMVTIQAPFGNMGKVSRYEVSLSVTFTYRQSSYAGFSVDNIDEST